MFKFLVPRSRLNILRYLTKTNKCRNECNPALRITSKQQFHTSRLNHAIDPRIRDVYEYPDLANNDDDVAQPYTNWEGVENRYAHSVMEKNERYHSTVALIPAKKSSPVSKNELVDALSKNWRLEGISETVETLRRVSQFARDNNEDIYAEEYATLLDYVADNSKLLTDEQLLNVLQSLMLWFIQTIDDNSAYSRLCSALDQECEARGQKWSTKKQFLVLDHWYRLRLIRRSKFARNTITRLGNDAAILSPSNIVQLMFYVSVSRTRLVNFRQIEAYLNLNAKLLNIDELAVVSLGFFKTQTAIRDRRLLGYIIRRTIKEIESIKDISLTAILKVVR